MCLSGNDNHPREVVVFFVFQRRPVDQSNGGLARRLKRASRSVKGKWAQAQGRNKKTDYKSKKRLTTGAGCAIIIADRRSVIGVRNATAGFVRRREMKKGEKRKQELIRIAYRLLVSKGYEQTSVDEIIEEAGIAKGTYYYHFESKEQILE